ncbi:MAG TPA: hypothetical protein VFC79_12385 [Tissierellaceae bacterium]|nr:hypothetical protein [Tissierellaceae bacterium]
MECYNNNRPLNMKDYLSEDFPYMLAITCILIIVAIEKYNNNLILSIIIATVIYLITYIIYKVYEAIEE